MNNEKWTCSFCTYVNWSASQRCVICRNEKVVNLLNQEIYNVEILNSDKINLNDHNLSEICNKWACYTCTYLNWPKARKCVQCNTSRFKESSPSPVQEDLSSDNQYSKVSSKLQFNANETEATDYSKNDNGKATSSNHDELTQNSKESINLSKILQKWICQACTYENWPKSKICVMCKASLLSEIGDDQMRSHSLLSPQNETNDENRVSPTTQNLNDIWLIACESVLNGNLFAFESYLLAVDGKLDRELTVQDCQLLNQSDILKPGLTLLDLACKLGRDDFVELYLSTPYNTAQGPINATSTRQRMPCHISPDRALAIQTHLYETIRIRKGDFPCYIVEEQSTFWLPAEIELLPLTARSQLLDELVDKNVLQELEINEKVINWWAKNSNQNRLTPLWNRTAGDCLLDSVLQATWGILDRDNILRIALADSMREAKHIFYPCWREYERIQALAFNYTIDDIQLHRDWENLLQIACQQGEPLEQIHIFVLCHIIRRPIIVYGVKYINNYRNEPVGLSHFQGVYLPLLWEKSFCSRNPIVLGYTRGHFSALVPSETLPTTFTTQAKSSVPKSQQVTHVPSNGSISYPSGGCLTGRNNDGHGLVDNIDLTVHVPINNPSICLLPLYDCNKVLLPVHFLNENKSLRNESVLRDWLDVAMTRRGYLTARMRSARRNSLVSSLIESWLDHYRSSLSQESQLSPSLEFTGACSPGKQSPSEEQYNGLK